jgi:hypothetical protein
MIRADKSPPHLVYKGVPKPRFVKPRSPGGVCSLGPSRATSASASDPSQVIIDHHRSGAALLLGSSSRVAPWSGPGWVPSSMPIFADPLVFPPSARQLAPRHPRRSICRCLRWNGGWWGTALNFQRPQDLGSGRRQSRVLRSLDWGRMSTGEFRDDSTETQAHMASSTLRHVPEKRSLSSAFRDLAKP